MCTFGGEPQNLARFGPSGLWGGYDHGSRVAMNCDGAAQGDTDDIVCLADLALSWDRIAFLPLTVLLRSQQRFPELVVNPYVLDGSLLCKVTQNSSTRCSSCQVV
jgi:hypothetical protein